VPRQFKCLDLFCGAGGATKGLQRAGFHVTGIDIKRQPRYCGDLFIQADALAPPLDLAAFDLVWASPPCQAHSSVTPKRHRHTHMSLIEPTRQLLRSARAFVIENVPGAPLRPDVVLDGSMFGANTYRKRVFETSFFCLTPTKGRPFGPWSRPGSVGVYGRTGSATAPGGVTRKRVSRGNLNGWREAMGIDWMTAAELANAVPPAYSEFIGRAALRQAA
jgi:DNA (cytosine-5)-methyltransferase 1